jgi:hypothetical protein
MALGFEQVVELLEERIEILKQNLRFFVADYRVEYVSKIITIKRELDKAVQVRMKLSEICYHPNNNRVAVSAA